MASVEIVDETVVVVSRDALAALVADRSRWVAWWPGLEVSVVVDRGVEGMTWAVAGALVGTSDVRLVPQETGVLVRYRLDADPTAPGSRTTARPLPASPHGRRAVEEIRVRHVMAWRRTIWALADELGAEG
jgi:hypothetical protein